MLNRLDFGKKQAHYIPSAMPRRWRGGLEQDRPALPSRHVPPINHLIEPNCPEPLNNARNRVAAQSLFSASACSAPGCAGASAQQVLDARVTTPRLFSPDMIPNRNPRAFHAKVDPDFEIISKQLEYRCNFPDGGSSLVRTSSQPQIR
jgi:hypothetical protein